MRSADLAINRDPGTVWHIGYAPEPWEWSDWKYAAPSGRFEGRWDDPEGQFRTIYVGSSLFACLVEVLAKFRPHGAAVAALQQVISDSSDDDDYPTTFGAVNLGWLDEHRASQATLRGAYCAVTNSRSVARLRPTFLTLAIQLHSPDFDVATLKESAPRDLTRAVARWLYDAVDDETGTAAVDGIEFTSRHGDDLFMWAVFERPTDGPVSELLGSRREKPLTHDHPDILSSFELHGLHWAG